MTESELGRSLREQIDARLEQADLQPDPQDMFERAARLDPGRLEDAAVLRPFVQAYRDRLDAQVQTREAGAPPPAARRRPSITWVVTAAAAVLLVTGVASSMGRWRQAMVQSSDASGHEAQHGSTVDRSVQEATNLAPPPRSPAPVQGSPATEPDPVPLPPVLEPEPRNESEATVDPVRTPSLAERLDALDASAQAAWRRGQLRKAEQGYRAVVRLGGRREVAEMAYGELFAIVRQRGGDLPSLWRAYLRKFPRGRYAEDVTAGLCRRALSSERGPCWDRYRARFPNGIHAP